MTKRRYESIINFFHLARVSTASFNARRSISSIFALLAQANFRRLSSPLRLKKLKSNEVGHVGQKRSSAAKKKEATFSSSQRTKNIQRLKTKCSRSRLPAARYVHNVVIFFRANVVSKRGFRVRVRVASGGSVARNLRAKFFFDCEKRIGCAFPGTRRFSRLVQLGGGERFRSREAFGAHRAMFSRRNDIVWCSSVVLSMV